jgi:benzodiazapine receptor
MKAGAGTRSRRSASERYPDRRGRGPIPCTDIRRFIDSGSACIGVASVFVRVTQFFAAIVICLLAGLIGSIFTAPAVPTWYATLTKPALTPPAWLFGPVWTVLFILMGIALYLVWRKGWEQKDVQVATAIFAVQLALNVLWSYFFFGLQVPFLALIEIVLLWVAVCITIGAFYRVSIPATALLLPYLLWVTFAAYLTYGIYTLNPL